MLKVRPIPRRGGGGGVGWGGGGGVQSASGPIRKVVQQMRYR